MDINEVTSTIKLKWKNKVNGRAIDYEQELSNRIRKRMKKEIQEKIEMSHNTERQMRKITVYQKL